jgi:hypothetical protein
VTVPTEPVAVTVVSYSRCAMEPREKAVLLKLNEPVAVFANDSDWYCDWL